jgi:hypothetical protein
MPEQRLSYLVNGSSFDEKLEWQFSYVLTPEASDTILDSYVNIPLHVYNIMAIFMGPLLWFTVTANMKRELAALSVLAPLVYARREHEYGK